MFYIGDLFQWERFITPSIIKLFYWLVVIMVVLAGLSGLVAALGAMMLNPIAGAIHTDFERGFIRAETIAYDDYVGLGGEAAARDAGRLRLEGKDYVVSDGDVMHFRFAT